MKKTGILIATGTIGGMGAVFAVTPPQFGNNATGVDQMAAPAASQSPTATAPTPAATPAPSKGSSTPTPQATTPAAPTPAPTKAASGKVTVTGNSYAASERGRNWGDVTVTVTFVDGVITAVKGKQSPTSRGQWAFNQLDPYVSGQKITVAGIKSKSANSLAFVSGVSYSSMAYWESLKSAITKAGL